MWLLYRQEQELEIERLKLLARLIAVELYGPARDDSPQSYAELINDRLPGMVMKQPREAVPVITEEMKKKWGVYEDGEFIGLRAKTPGRATREEREAARPQHPADKGAQVGAPFMPPFENA